MPTPTLCCPIQTFFLTGGTKEQTSDTSSILSSLLEAAEKSWCIVGVEMEREELEGREGPFPDVQLFWCCSKQVAW